NSGRASRTDSMTAGSSAAPTAVTNRQISPTPRRGRPCDSTPEGTRAQRRPRLPAQTKQRHTRQRQARRRQASLRQVRWTEGAAAAPTAPIAGAVKYSTRFECYARVDMVTASTAGVDCCISFGGWQRPQGTGTVGTRVLRRDRADDVNVG